MRVKNTLLLDALHCRNTKRAPVWLMRQAGRYMPEYRALRQKHSFLDMCHTPNLIAEVTELPIRRFGMDAAILFSDILVIPEAYQIGLHFDDGVGPIIDRPLNTPGDIAALPNIDVHSALKYVSDGIKLLVPTLDVPLIGFCGAPFTMASYMIEGKSSRDLRKTKQWMLRDPTSFHTLLDKLADDATAYLQMQINAGVSAVQIFDSWAGVLGHRQFLEFSLAYLDKITKNLKGQVPTILFCRGASVFASELAKIHPNAIGIDWNADIGSLRAVVPPTIALQGNLDPDLLYAPTKHLRIEVQGLLKTMQSDRGYIFNLGHGIAPDVSPDAVQTLIDTVVEGL